MRFGKPAIYQGVKEDRREIAGGYQILPEAGNAGAKECLVSFNIGRYDRSLPLVIDPIIWNSSYIGGSAFDAITGLAVSSSGETYLTGTTSSSDFLQSGTATGVSAFMARIGIAGGSGSSPTLLQLTLLGGVTGDTRGGGIAVSPIGGDAFVCGSTQSPTFPVTATAFDPTHNGGFDVFVSRIDGDGNLKYSSFLGGVGDDLAADIALEPVGSSTFFITGSTKSATFPQRGAARPWLAPTRRRTFSWPASTRSRARRVRWFIQPSSLEHSQAQASQMKPALPSP